MGEESSGRDKIDGKVVRSSWEKAGLLLPLNGSGDDARAGKALNSDAQGKPMDADSCEEDGIEDDFPQTYDIGDNDDTRTVGQCHENDADVPKLG